MLNRSTFSVHRLLVIISGAMSARQCERGKGSGNEGQVNGWLCRCIHITCAGKQHSISAGRQAEQRAAAAAAAGLTVKRADRLGCT